MNQMKVILGGTFGYLHIGHKALIKKALQIGDFIYVGLTTDEYVRSMKPGEKLPSYKIRRAAIYRFMKPFGKRFEISPLDDRFGPSISGDFDAIIVSSETLPTAIEINKRRAAAGLRKLSIVKIKNVLAEDSIPVSTTRILKGEIDRNGKVIERPRRLFN